MDRTRLEDAWGRHSPSWVEVIDRIVGVLPGVPLRIWQQEVYAENAPYVLNQFVGVEIADIPSIAPPKSTMTPSAQAVQAAESFVRSFRGSRSDLTAAVDRIYASMPVSESESRFTLVDDQQRRQMRKQYDRDIEIIQRRWPGALIRP